MRFIFAVLTATPLALASAGVLADASDGLDVSGFGRAVALDVLDTQRGGQSLQIDSVVIQNSNQQVGASLNGNALLAGINGTNTVSSGVFSGASGVTTLIQNSGNQVIIQNSTIINLLMK
jgi:hypothetical protein